MSEIEKVHSVAVLPVDVEVRLQKLIGTDPLPDMSARLRRPATERLVDDLRRRFPSVAAVDLPGLPESVRQTADELEKLFRADVGTPVRPLTDDGDNVARIGSQVVSLAAQLGVDAVAIARMNAVTKTADRISGELLRSPCIAAASSRLPETDASRLVRLAGGPPPPKYIYIPPVTTYSPPAVPVVASMVVAVIDGRTGRLLWSQVGQVTRSDPPEFRESDVPPLVSSALSEILRSPDDLMVGTDVPDELVGQTLFTCCNLVFDKRGGATDANYLYLDEAKRHQLPAGSRVRVLSAGKNELAFEVPGEPTRYTLTLEYGTARIRAVPYFRRILLPENPLDALSSVSSEISAGIADGRLVYGMTKAEAIVARGYPPLHQTGDTEMDEWLYYDEPGMGQYVRFDGGRIISIKAGTAP